jgi:hypothetical protein
MAGNDDPDRAAAELMARSERDALERTDDEALPVVARLVVEIRSDGRRTIARGALEDAATQQRVAVEARGESPLQLAIALTRSLTQLPKLTLQSAARSAWRGLLGRGKRGSR